jgi:hypothetical protein
MISHHPSLFSAYLAVSISALTLQHQVKSGEEFSWKKSNEVF